jgi:hypothetical protein
MEADAQSVLEKVLYIFRSKNYACKDKTWKIAHKDLHSRTYLKRLHIIMDNYPIIHHFL